MAEKPYNSTAPLKAAGVLAGLFVLLTLMVVAGTPLDAIDQRVAEMTALDAQSREWFTALTITDLGGGATVILVMLVMSLMLLRSGEAGLLLPQWGGFLAARGLTDGLKHIIGRERMAMTETTEMLAHASSPSFPSGHATSAMIVYGFLGFLLLRSRLPAAFSRIVGVILAALIAAVAASRMLLGVHYLSDVLGGLLSGSLALALAVSAANTLENRKI